MGLLTASGPAWQLQRKFKWENFSLRAVFLDAAELQRMLNKLAIE